MVKLKIVWTKFAISELKSIYEFYKYKAGISVAEKIKKRIFIKVKQLQNHPLSGAIEENLFKTEYDYRYLVEGNYKIIYRIENKDVFIIDIFDCRRNPQDMKYSLNKE